MTQIKPLRHRAVHSGLIVLSCCLLVLIILAPSGHHRKLKPTLPPGTQARFADPLLNRAAPVWTLPDQLHPTDTIDSRHLAGHPYLFTVWASWCPACVSEQAALRLIAARYRLCMIGYDWKDQPANAQRWLAEKGNPFTNVVSDDDGTAALDWGVIAAPESFLVDGNGFIRWIHRGPLTAALVATEIFPRLAQMQVAPHPSPLAP